MTNDDNGDKNKEGGSVVSLSINCKCGKQLEMPLPRPEFLFNVNVCELILISIPPELRTCPACGLTYAPRFKANVPPELVMSMVEWAAFQFKKPRLAAPTLDDVQKFGKT